MDLAIVSITIYRHVFVRTRRTGRSSAFLGTADGQQDALDNADGLLSGLRRSPSTRGRLSGTLLSRINYREILGSGSLSFIKTRLSAEREMMDQLFPRAPLSTYPFFSSFLRRPSNPRGARGRREGLRRGREKRETETRNCRTTYHHGAHTILFVNGVASPIIDSILRT